MNVQTVYSSAYAAAAGRESWQTPLNGVAEVLELWGAQIVGVDKRRGSLVFSASSTFTPPEVELDYIRFYHPINPRLAPSLALRSGEWMHCHELFNDRYVAGSPFYQDFLIPHGGRYLSGTKLVDDEDFVFMIGLMRGAGQQPIGAAEMPVLEAVRHHFGEAMQNFIHLRRAHAELHMAHAFFAQFTYPMLLLDESRGIWHANAPAMRLLETSDLLHDQEGVLACNCAADSNALTEAIRSVHLMAKGDGRAVPHRALSLQRPDGSRMHLFLSLLRPDTCLGMFGLAPRALLIVHDARDAGGDLDPMLVAESFSLTPAEARVAVKLAQGRTVKEVAADHRTSIATVRSQVQQALLKVGVARQTDLVRLLLALPLRK